MVRKFLSFTFLILLFVASTYAQDNIQSSFGAAPYSIKSEQAPFYSPLNATNRGFVYISGTSSHQLNKQVMGNVTVTAIGSPFTTAGWVGALGRNTVTGVLYVNNQASPFQIWSVDTNTGVCTQVLASCTGIPHANFTGIVFDHTTSTWYGISSDLATSAIFTINMSTGVCTPVGSSSATCAGGISLACAPNGTLFSTDIVGNNLYKWNKTTGQPTLVGALGFDANYGQDAAFDLSDGMFYLNSAGPGNILRVCDTTTGSATTTIGTYAGQPSCLIVIGNMGPTVSHTPLPNTQNLTGPYVVNAVVSPQGSPISSSKIFWSRNNTSLTDSVTMTNSSGNNWTGNIPGNGSAATYRYRIKAIDGLGRVGYHPSASGVNTFLATSTDTSKPVITHTPIGPTPLATWPATVNCTVTDPFGVDSVWVVWRKNSGANTRFNLAHGSGDNWSGQFPAGGVAVNDVIYYKIIARDASAQQNKDSTAQYNFTIIALVNACIGTGTTSSNYPFTTYWMDGRTQMLFTAAELNGAGLNGAYNITKLGFNVITAASQTMNGFTVSFQHTTQSTLTGWVTTGWTVGYTGTYAVPGTGWQYIDMTGPNYFVYNGTSNLLIEVCYDNSSYTSYSPVNSTAASGMTWGYYTDNQTGCTMTSGAGQANRPNVCLTCTPATGVGNNNGYVPSKFSLAQNYPNPFNPVTRINFDIPKQGFVSLKVFDVLGREVKTLLHDVKDAGSYSVDFNGTELSSGVYFYRLESNGFTDIKKMMLIK